MKKVLWINMLLVLVLCIGIVPASAAADDDWSFATVQVSLEENIVCAKYDVWVYLDDELIDIIRPGGISTSDLLLQQGKHKLTLVPDSLLADPKVWSFSVSRANYTIDCSLQAHIFSLQYDRYSICEGNAGISHQEKSRLLDRVEEGASFIRILSGI